jgi:hypothetical protein
VQEQTSVPLGAADLELSEDQLDSVVGGLTRVFMGPQDAAPAGQERVQIPGLSLHRNAEPALRP